MTTHRKPHARSLQPAALGGGLQGMHSVSSGLVVKPLYHRGKPGGVSKFWAIFVMVFECRPSATHMR